MTDVLSRAQAYVATMPIAVAGQHGHTATFKVAVSLVIGFGLSEDEALPLLEEYSDRCQPPWSRKELEHKLQSAEKVQTTKPRGYLRDARREPEPDEPPPPRAPRRGAARRSPPTAPSRPPGGLPGARLPRHRGSR